MKNLPFLIGNAFCLFFFSGSSLAACDNFNPVTGQTVTCDASAPNPVSTTIQAAINSSNVVVNLLSGSALDILHNIAAPLAAVSVEANSQINNSGTISLTGGSGSGTNRGAALLGSGNGNTLINRSSGLINTTGTHNDGMAANGSNNILINQGIITTAGPNAYGMTASWGQTNTGQSNNQLINQGSISTSGSNARAMSILGQDSTVTNSGILQTTGTNSNAVYMQGNNDRFINTGLIHTSGASSDAVFSNTAGSNFTARIENLFGGQIISEQGAAIRTLNGASKIVNAGLLQSNSGQAILGGTGNIDLSLQTGSKIIGLVSGSGGQNQVNLEGVGLIDNPFQGFQRLEMRGRDWTWNGSGDFQDSFIYQGIFRLQSTFTGNVSIDPGATLAVVQNTSPEIIPSSATGAAITVRNSGVIDLGIDSTSAVESLTILGNYQGNNGLLNVKTQLGSDFSPSNRLVISEGRATGSTMINVSNLNGKGALTIGNGILVVDAINGGTTSNEAFRLSNPGAYVAAGPYAYTLSRGSVDSSNTESWYLRSILNCSPGSTNLLCSELKTEGLPNYRPEVSLYTALPSMALFFGQTLLDSLYERVGNPEDFKYGERNNKLWSGTWGRVIGQHGQNEGDRLGVYRTGPEFNYNLGAIQFGHDFYGSESSNGSLNYLGLYGVGGN